LLQKDPTIKYQTLIQNITAMQPTHKQEKDKTPNTQETSTPNTESVTKITKT